jgi:putative membrane protein insertion efficiency factor
MKKILIGLVRFYQICFSALFGFNKCRFVPTCSNYMIEAISKKGVIKGLFLGVKRIAKCHPFSGQSGIDYLK